MRSKRYDRARGDEGNPPSPQPRPDYEIAGADSSSDADLSRRCLDPERHGDMTRPTNRTQGASVLRPMPSDAPTSNSLSNPPKSLVADERPSVAAIERSVGSSVKLAAPQFVANVDRRVRMSELAL